MQSRTCRQLGRICEPHGGALDAGWPQIPVCHLAFETDTHFHTIDCRP